MEKPESTSTSRRTPRRPRDTKLHLVFFVVPVLLIAFTASGCKKTKKPTTPRVIIKDIEFKGNTRFTKETLLEHLEIGETKFGAKIGLGEKFYYSRWRARDDQNRIVELYRSAGYYQARVLGIEAKPIKKDPKKVKLIISIDEGEPVLVNDIDVVWTKPGPDGARVEKRIALKVDEPFDVAELNRSKEGMMKALHDLGFALAEVVESARVDTARNQATVRFEISPGPHCIIGEIRLRGLDRVPADLVAIETEIAKAQPYSPELVRRLESRLIGLQVFYVVSVTHDDHLDETGRLGLEIAFVEGNTRRLQMGGGFAIEPDRWLLRATSTYSQHNLFGRMYDLRVRVNFGWAVLPYPWQIDSHGPVALFEPSIGKKGLLEKDLFWRLTPSFAVDIEQDYKFMSPAVRLGVSRFLWDITVISLNYNFEFYYMYGESDLGRQEMDAIGIASEDGRYRLAYLELGYRVMLIDMKVDQTNVARILDPKNGAVFEVVYKIATPYLGGVTQYHDIHPSIKTYWQIFSHLQLACRVETGLIFPFGDFEDPTVWSNYFLGGYNTVRGWGGSRLAPRVEYCSEDECDETRVGGWTMVMGNVELRAMTIPDLYVVAFFDVGDVQSGVAEYKPEKWNYTAGGGLRYDSPVGKIRVDFGYRINEPEPDWDEPRWGLHLGLGEAF